MDEDRVEQVARLISADWYGDPEHFDEYSTLAKSILSHLEADFAARVRGAVEVLPRLLHALSRNGIADEDTDAMEAWQQGHKVLAILTTAAPTPCPRCAEVRRILEGAEGETHQSDTDGGCSCIACYEMDEAAHWALRVLRNEGGCGSCDDDEGDARGEEVAG